MECEASSVPAAVLGEFRTRVNGVFEERLAGTLDRAQRPENFDDCIGTFDLDVDDLVCEIKAKLFGIEKKPRHLYTEHIYADTFGLYTRDELLKRAASETYRLRGDRTELQAKILELEDSNMALRKQMDTLQTGLAKLTLDWYMAKESAVRMQERVLLVYDRVANHLCDRHERRLKADVFRGWLHATMAMRVEAAQEEMAVLRSHHTETCYMLSQARKRVDILEVYASQRQMAAVKLKERRLMRRYLCEWRIETVLLIDAELRGELHSKEAQVLTASLAEERKGREAAAFREELESLRGAQEVILCKLEASQGRTAFAVDLLLRHGLLRWCLRCWWAAAASQAHESSKGKTEALRATLGTQLAETTAIAEHWKATADNYWDKIKAASSIIGRRFRLVAYRNAMDLWLQAVAWRRRLAGMKVRAVEFETHRRVTKTYRTWKDNVARISRERQDHGLRIAADGLRLHAGAALGWAVAAAWIGRVYQGTDMRSAFQAWRHNVTVSFARHVIEEEEELRVAAEARTEEMQGKAERVDYMQQLVMKWNLRRFEGIQREIKHRYIERWYLDMLRSKHIRKIRLSMEREVEQNQKLLQCTLRELSELRQFKDVVINSGSTESLVIKRGGGFQSLQDVLKQAMTRLSRGVVTQLQECPGWDHAKILAEYYGLDCKFVSVKTHGDAGVDSRAQMIPRAPKAAKKPTGASPRVKNKTGSKGAKASASTKGGKQRAASAPPARPRAKSAGRSRQTQGYGPWTDRSSIAASGKQLPRLPQGALATTTNEASFGLSPWQAGADDMNLPARSSENTSGLLQDHAEALLSSAILGASSDAVQASGGVHHRAPSHATQAPVGGPSSEIPKRSPRRISSFDVQPERLGAPAREYVFHPDQK